MDSTLPSNAQLTLLTAEGAGAGRACSTLCSSADFSSQCASASRLRSSSAPRSACPRSRTGSQCYFCQCLLAAQRHSDSFGHVGCNSTSHRPSCSFRLMPAQGSVLARPKD